MTLSTTFTIPTVEGVYPLPHDAVDPLTGNTVQQLYESAEGILFLALISTSTNPNEPTDFTFLEGKRFWQYVKENTPGELVIPETADKVERVFFYHIDTPKLRSQKWTPEVRFMCDPNTLTPQTFPSFLAVIENNMPPAFFEIDHARHSRKTLTEAMESMKSGQGNFEDSPFTIADLLAPKGAEGIMTDNVLSIGPAFIYEEMRKDPAAFYVKQNAEAHDLVDEMLQLYAGVYPIAGVRLLTEPEFFKDVPIDPNFIVSQGIFFSLLCIERGIEIGGDILREILMMDSDHNEGRGLDAFNPEHYTAIKCFQECENVTQAIVDFLENIEGMTAPIAFLLGLAYWEEPPLKVQLDIQKAADYLAMAADREDPEALYYMASFDLSQYQIDPDPEFLSNFWVSIEALVNLGTQEELEGTIEEALLSLPDIIEQFEATNRAHWPEGATEKALRKLKALIASFGEEEL